MAKRDFNLAAKIFLGLSVVDIVLNIVKAYTKYQVTFTGGETLIIEMSINLMILIAIVFTFLKKRWALISLIALYIIRMFAVVSYGTDISVSYQLGGNFVYLIRDFAWFAIAMCFKKNGVSGWKAMLASEESLSRFDSRNVHSVPPPIIKDNEEFTNLTDNVIDNSQVENNPLEDVISTHRESNPKTRKFLKKFLIWVICSIPVIAITAFMIVILTETYPKHIDRFGDKVKYYCDLPNTKLANEYWEKYENAKAADLLDLSVEYLTVVQLSYTKDLGILEKTMEEFYDVAREADDDLEYYRKVISIANRILKIDKNNINAYEHLVRAYYNTDCSSDAFKSAESLLILQPLNPIGINAMCRKADESENWETLLKWAEKGYNQVSKENPNYIEYMYFYAKAIYESGDKILAKQIYLEAEVIAPNNYYHDRYIRVGGRPCDIESVTVTNQTYDGTIIRGPGGNFYDDNTRYFCPSIKVKPYRSGEFEFYVKFYQNGNLRRGSKSPEDYTYSSTIKLDKNKAQMKFELGGWGADEPGTWEPGGYRIEIWWDGAKLASKSFNVYDESTYRIWGRNAFK